jgi:hypothetical protein
MKSGEVIKVARPYVHPLVLGLALYLRINHVKLHLNLFLSIWSMITM